MKTFLLKSFKIIITLLIFWQFLSWVGMGLLYSTGKEHPLSDIENFVVSDSGDIIIAETFYAVIQVYDKNGKFKTSWEPERNGHKYKMFLGTNNTIAVAIDINASSQKYIYTFQGKLIKDQSFTLSPNDALNSKNYKLEKGSPGPEIIKVSDNNKKTIVLRRA